MKTKILHIVTLLAVIAISGCAPQKPSGPPPKLSDFGGISMITLTSAEIKAAQLGAKDLFEAQARSQSGAAIISGYDPYAPPRAFRGEEHEVIFVPFKGKAVSAGGGVDFTHYFLGFRKPGEKKWNYVDAFQIDQKELARKFPGLKEIGAIPPSNVKVSGRNGRRFGQ